MTESSEEYSHASESIELVLFSVVSIIPFIATLDRR